MPEGAVTLARIFIDHQNLLKRWLAATNGATLDISKIPSVFATAASAALVRKRLLRADGAVNVADSRIFASQLKATDAEIADIANNRGLDATRLRRIRERQQASIGAMTNRFVPPEWLIRVGDCNVYSPDTLVCLGCDRPTMTCGICMDDLVVLQEKGVDMRLGVEMVELAWTHETARRVAEQNGTPFLPVLEVAVLATSDSDLIPAVLNVKKKGVIVVNAAWRTNTGRLPGACNASFYIDDYIEDLKLGQGAAVGITGNAGTAA